MPGRGRGGGGDVTDNVIKVDFPTGDLTFIEPDKILENNKGAFDEVMVIGWKDGLISVASSYGVERAYLTCGFAQRYLLNIVE